MLEVTVKILLSIVLYTFGYLVTKEFLQKKDTVLSLKTILIIIVASISTLLVTYSEYSILTPILSYIILIIMYKLIFNISITQSVIASGTYLILIFLAEVLFGPILLHLFPNGESRTDLIPMIFTNIFVPTIAYLLSKIKFINNIFKRLLEKSNTPKIEKTVTFIMLTIVIISMIFSILSNTHIMNTEKLICLATIGVFIILFIIYSKEQNEYTQLNNQYNHLLEYVKEFETWIDSTEMDKHEYKNDLAVLQTKIKDPEIKKFIEDKLTSKMAVSSEWMQSLNNLPIGGMKGLLYYKIVLAKNNKIELKIDISKKSKKLFSKISDKEYKVLCQLFGIYLDNALEAAKNSKEKSMSVEIYELNKNLTIAISNSFSGKIDLSKINEKGYTTKGVGHGRGLHFASKLLEESDTFISKNRICNDYYVQQIIIKNKETSK